MKPAPATRCDYDAMNRRTASIAANGHTDSFLYDPSGYRIQKTDSLGMNKYLLEGEHLEAIYNAGGVVQAQYLRGSVIDEIVNGYQLDGGKLVNYTFHHDSLQSVLGQSGHEGSILATQSYGAFGNLLASTGNSPNKLKFTGREEDSDTGVIYYRARYLDPAIGRFPSEDPKGFSAGVNFYAYCSNNPVNCSDPSGKDGVNAGITLKLLGEGITNTISVRYPGISNEPWDLQLQTGLSPGIITKSIIGQFDPENPMIQSAGLEFVKGTLNLGWDFGSNSGSGVNLNADIHAGFGFLGGTGTIQNLLDKNSPSIPSSFELNLGVQYGASISPELQFTFSGRDLINIIGDQLSSGSTYATGGFVLYPNKSNSNMMRAVYKK